MMPDTDILRFVPGRKFASNKNGTIWKINSVDPIDETLHVEDDTGYKCRIFTEQFDKHYYFLDELTEVDKWIEQLIGIPQCDCGGLKTYGSKQPEYHSNWCSLKKGQI